MEHLTLRKPDLVVALDIGSTYSGYAWQWRSDFLHSRSNVEFNTNWGRGTAQLHKTKTCLLLDEKKEIDSFGNKADHRFCHFGRHDLFSLHGKWYFFKRFKLLLYLKQIPEECEDDIGQHLPFKEVMTKFVKALRDDFLEKMKIKNVKLDVKKTLWVITVPQIWSNEAKQFMRECAENSGIGKKNLLLALEPEAAAITCIYLPQQQRDAMDDLGRIGDRFVTADLGGGTADFSAIEVLPEGQIKEICPGQGSLVGGQDVNHAFFQSCCDIFEQGVWHSFFDQRNATDLLRFEEFFEKEKMSIGTDKDEQFVCLEIPLNMQWELKNGTITLKSTATDSQYFKQDKGQFLFDPNLVREKLFNETVKRVIKALVDTLRLVTGITKVILVGGFSESPIVVDQIRQSVSEEFPDVKIYVPTSPFKAVLYGAVLFGHDPFIFKSRISRETYGIRTNVVFDEEKHDKDKRWENASNGIEYCKEVFDIHVRKGQSVLLKQNQPSRTYNPLSIGQRTVNLSIYSSTDSDPKYTTESSCTKHGDLNVDMPDLTGEMSREVLVTMMYGGTELAVTAVDVTTGKEFDTTVKFV